MNSVQDKVALVTGGAKGIGEATAKLLAEAGAKVVVTDVDEVGGNATAKAIVAAGEEAVFIRHDVTQEAEWEGAIARAQEEFGGLDILVNNAGVMLTKPLELVSMDEYRKITSVNLDGVFLGIKHAIPAMRERAADSVGGASIVNLSSVAGFIGAPMEAIYGMTKGGVRLLTKSAALECASLGYRIRVNSVHPGVIETPMCDEAVDDLVALGAAESPEALLEAMILRHPIGRLGKPEDIARAILFLASDDASFITGTELVVDGGFTAS